MATPIATRCHDGSRPGRLWSLWDMIVDLQIGRFVDCFNTVSSWVQAAVTIPPGNGFRTDKRSFDELKKNVASLLDISELCGFDVIALWARQALAELELIVPQADGAIAIPPPDLLRVRGALGRLKDGIIGQAQTRSALILDAHSKELWDPTRPPFGLNFRDRFQKSQYDLDEACKCLALARSTATVFHLMRITESGLNAIHLCLGIQVALVGNDRNWGNILGRVKTEIGARGRNWAERELFQELYALLDSVKDAWRNATMHIENKYTPDEAAHIFAMVKGFMMKISDRMDENGEPKA